MKKYYDEKWIDCRAKEIRSRVGDERKLAPIERVSIERRSAIQVESLEFWDASWDGRTYYFGCFLLDNFDKIRLIVYLKHLLVGYKKFLKSIFYRF